MSLGRMVWALGSSMLFIEIGFDKGFDLSALAEALILELMADLSLSLCHCAIFNCYCRWAISRAYCELISAN